MHRNPHPGSSLRRLLLPALLPALRRHLAHGLPIPGPGRIEARRDQVGVVGHQRRARGRYEDRFQGGRVVAPGPQFRVRPPALAGVDLMDLEGCQGRGGGGLRG